MVSILVKLVNRVLADCTLWRETQASGRREVGETSKSDYGFFIQSQQKSLVDNEPVRHRCYSSHHLVLAGHHRGGLGLLPPRLVYLFRDLATDGAVTSLHSLIIHPPLYR